MNIQSCTQPMTQNFSSYLKEANTAWLSQFFITFVHRVCIDEEFYIPPETGTIIKLFTADIFLLPLVLKNYSPFLSVGKTQELVYKSEKIILWTCL